MYLLAGWLCRICAGLIVRAYLRRKFNGNRDLIASFWIDYNGAYISTCHYATFPQIVLEWIMSDLVWPVFVFKDTWDLLEMIDEYAEFNL
jgi:hypothetical protein